MTPDISAIAQRITAEVEENYGHCCNEGGTNLAIGPETFAELLTQAAAEATSSLRAQLEELNLEKLNTSIQLAAVSRFSYDKRTGWEVPSEPRPMYAKTFVEALRLFMEMNDREDKRQRDALEAAEGERDVALARQERLITACENSIRALKPFIVAAEDWTETQKRMQVTAPLAQVLHELETQLAPESPLNGKPQKEGGR